MISLLLAAAEINRLWFALPLIVSVSLVYAATRHERMGPIVTHAVRFGVWVGVFLLAAFALLWFVSRNL